MVPRPRLIAINPRYRRPQHRWTQEERLLLCCAKRFFDLKYKDIAKIFNHIYATEIRAEGFSEGLPARTLNTQWEDMRRRDHRDWRAVHYDVSFDQGPSLYHHLMEKIRHACHALHIGLVARARDLVQTPQGRPIIPQSHTPQQSSGTRMIEIPGAPVQNTILHSPVIDQEVTIDQENIIDQGRPEILTQPSQTPQTRQSIARIRSFGLRNRSDEPIRPSQVPHILWRFSNDGSMGINHRSGYIANAFINEIGNIPTPNERAQEFPTWLEIHVRPRKIPSPFISTSTDPLFVVHRALTRDDNAFVSIIDSTQVNSRNIFYMKDLMQQYNIYTPGYRGAKEYVIWGCICRPAIVASFRADELVQIANAHPDIRTALQLDIITASLNCKSQLHKRLAAQTFRSDFAVGKTIGKFLRIIRLQPHFLEDVAKSLNTSWSFTISDDTAEFLRGVNQGFQTTTAPSSPLHTREITFHSQDTASSQNQDEITFGNAAQQVAQNVDREDYVIVDHPQRENIAYAQAELRQSIDRLSFQDDTEDFPDREIDPVTRSTPAIATTMATRSISLFNPDSESWVQVPETQRLTTPGVLESIENALPASGQGDDDGDSEGKIETEMESPTLPNRQPDISSQERAILQTPTTPIRNHIRSYSESSESTIGAQTTVANHRFSEDRSRVNRVLNYDWPTIWDSLHQVGGQ